MSKVNEPADAGRVEGDVLLDKRRLEALSGQCLKLIRAWENAPPLPEELERALLKLEDAVSLLSPDHLNPYRGASSAPREGAEPVRWEWRYRRGDYVSPEWVTAGSSERSARLDAGLNAPDDACAIEVRPLYAAPPPRPDPATNGGWRFDMENAPRDGRKVWIRVSWSRSGRAHVLGVKVATSTESGDAWRINCDCLPNDQVDAWHPFPPDPAAPPEPVFPKPADASYTPLSPAPYLPCPVCHRSTHARVHEKKADGHYANGPDLRCVNCKHVWRDPEAPPADAPPTDRDAAGGASEAEFEEWMEKLNVEVIQGEYGYEPSEYEAFPSLWRDDFDRGLSPSAAFAASLTSAEDSRRDREEQRRKNRERIQREDDALDPTPGRQDRTAPAVGEDEIDEAMEIAEGGCTITRSEMKRALEAAAEARAARTNPATGITADEAAARRDALKEAIERERADSASATGTEAGL